VHALELLLLWMHGLSGAAWFGAIFYKTFIIDAKAFSYFPHRPDYERFSTHLAHGMRHLVIAGLSVCGLSGFALTAVKWDSIGDTAFALLVAKLAVWIAAGALFSYVSWVHWPWRIFASPEEMPRYRTEGRWLAIGMVILTGAGVALGQAMRWTQPAT
jgi:hypothetical protein